MNTYIYTHTCTSGEASTYNGLYLTQDEMNKMASEGTLHGIPVKTEHQGQNVGSIVSSFVDAKGCLQCVMEVDESSVEGALVSGFVRDGIATELSMGYTVDVKHTDNNKLRAGEKHPLEISIVRKGARDGCLISAYQDKGKPMMYRKVQDPWAAFNLS